MKRILYTLIALVTIAMGNINLSAQNRTGYQMSSSPEDGSYKFVIEGKLDLNITDTSFNIYLTDIDGTINDNDMVTNVVVKDKKFRFETNIDVMKQGRLRGVLSNGDLNPAWINIYFIPGLTLYITIHDGYYDIQNEDQYKFMVSAWQNEVPVAALLARLGMGSSRGRQDNSNSKLKSAINSYENLQLDLKSQLNDISVLDLPYEEETKEKQKILQRIEQINAKMESLVDEYVKEINK